MTVNADEWVVHSSPAWAGAIDFVANAKIDDGAPGSLRFEQLLFQRVGIERFRLCCIPFFTYGYSLGDVVTLVEGGEDLGLSVGEVVERSDHWSFRALVAADAEATALGELLTNHDATIETLGRLVACSVVGYDQMRSLRSGLDALERDEQLSYETAWI